MSIEVTLPPGTRRVLVTGGGSGIGRAIVEMLAQRGGSVVASGRRADRLEDVAEKFPQRVFALECDLADAASRSVLLSRARELLGGLDGLVYCAGEVIHQPFGQIDERSLRTQVEVNLIAPLRIGEQALEILDQGGGMVFVASTLAARPVATSAVYSASKAGMLALVRALAIAGAPKGIRANAVSPGIVDTEMVRKLRNTPNESTPEDGEEHRSRVSAQLAAMAKLHPMGRLGSPAEVAEAVIHLLGAPWTTGAELVVDGGLVLRE